MLLNTPASHPDPGLQVAALSTVLPNGTFLGSSHRPAPELTHAVGFPLIRRLVTGTLLLLQARQSRVDWGPEGRQLVQQVGRMV